MVELRVGGDFHMDLSDLSSDLNPSSPLLLIAGGVGINPLFSLMKHAALYPHKRGPLHLLYSSKSQSELLYKVCESITFKFFL